jgi:hypothetical protein
MEIVNLANCELSNVETSRPFGRLEPKDGRNLGDCELRILQQIVQPYGSGNEPNIHNSQFTTA